jgi:hypothetical protein
MSSDQLAIERAMRLACNAAEEYIRCNGIPSDAPDEFIFHGDELADQYFQDCIAHLKWCGQCMTFDMADESMSVMLGDYTLESLA